MTTEGNEKGETAFPRIYRMFLDMQDTRLHLVGCVLLRAV